MARSLMPFGYGSNDSLFSLHREMNRLFDDVMRGGLPAVGGQGQATSLFNASMNVSETDRELRVTVELPGVAEQDIDISLDDDILTISGEKKAETQRGGEKENFHFIERSYGRFQRSLRLPFPANPDEVRAAFENGVLTVTVPRSAQLEKSRKIQIQGAGAQENRSEGGAGEGRPIQERQPPRDQPGATH